MVALCSNPRLAGWCLESLPVSYPAEVQMDEVGTPIVADTAAFQRDRGFSQLCSIEAWQADIDSLSTHMVAALGDTRATLGQQLIGFRRAVT